MASGIQGIDKLFNRIRRLGKAVKDKEKPLRAASVYMRGSIDKNFQAEGRPEKWTPLSQKTTARRRGKTHKILTDTARLRRSMNYKISGDESHIGTNTIYGPRQHFGYEGGTGRGRSKTPARSFLMFQEEDVREIGEIYKRHIRG